MVNFKIEKNNLKPSSIWSVIPIKTANIETLENKKSLEILEFKASFGQVAILPESKKIYLGLTFEAKQKSADPFYKANYYNLGAVLVRKISKLKLENINIQNSETFSENSKNLSDFVLGISQASWSLDTYLPTDQAKSKNINLYFDTALEALLTPVFLSNFEALNKGLTLTRSLVDDIPEFINPQTLPKIVDRELGNNKKVNLRHYNYAQIQELGMEGITFVGRASRYEPSMIHATVKPSGEVKQRICLVGKGVTYDSGGLDIKTDGHMKTMKSDMAGSATMFGVIKVLSEMDLQNTEVHWISAWVENMVDGSSYKSDDILTTYSGQTVEIWNTDAEGRLTLADTLTYATLQNPDYIVDAATLTGAAVVAVSEYYTAMMGNDKDLIDQLEQTFVSEGEKTVHTPLPEVLRSKVKGDLGELINISTLGRYAGHLTAGLFLSHFVDQKNFRNPNLKIENPKAFAWVHLDIAGSAMNKGMNDLEANGATGQSVRSLVNWILDLDKK